MELEVPQPPYCATNTLAWLVITIITVWLHMCESVHFLLQYLKIAGFKRRIAVYPDSGSCSKLCTAIWYWLTGLLLCTCPFRCWFDLRSAKAHYTVVKCVGVWGPLQYGRTCRSMKTPTAWPNVSEYEDPYSMAKYVGVWRPLTSWPCVSENEHLHCEPAY